jgi:nitrate reductase gamma subunit
MPTYTIDVISYLMGVVSGVVLVFALAAMFLRRDGSSRLRE